MYTADAVRGFTDDVKRLGRGDEVAVVMFTEFGCRVEENGSLGTDHGTATPMFIVGQRVKGSFYGRHPSLTDLDDGNMKMTTDFRRVYAARSNSSRRAFPSPAINKRTTLFPYAYASGSSLAEGATVDAQGNVYGADFLIDVRKFVPTRGRQTN